MKKYKPLACMLAAIAFALPAAACSAKRPSVKNDTAQIPEEYEPLPPTEELPVLPPAEEETTEEAGQEPTEEEVTPPAPSQGQEPAAPEPKNRAEYLMITADRLTVRSGAGTSYSALGSFERGVLVKYAGRTGNWYRTQYCGKTAYVSADYAKVVSLDAASDKAEAVIEEGLKYLGTPYVYGATRFHDGSGRMIGGFTTAKFDCSSLMQYIYYRGAGVLLNMTTRTQITQGVAVKPNDLQRGDLMFFTNASRKDNKGIERVGHVALYLGGNYILHTASDYAKIEQISSTRWGYFIEARRVL